METRGRGGAVLPVFLVCGLMAGAVGWPAEAEPAGRATVKRHAVPVYAQMTTSGEVVKSLQRGTVVTVDFALSGAEGAWCHVTVGARTGYVRCEELEREPLPRWREAPTPRRGPEGHGQRDVAREVRELKKFVRGQRGGETPLMQAAMSGDTGMVTALVAQGEDVNAKNRAGETALMAAAERGHYTAVQALLAAGSGVDASNTFGETPLMYAARNGHAAVAEALVAAGANVNAREENTIPVLQLAAQEGHTATVQVLLAAGADVNARSGGGYTALMWAAELGHISTVKALLAAGADVNARNQGGGTALLSARGNTEALRMPGGNSEIIRLLEEAGARE